MLFIFVEFNTFCDTVSEQYALRGKYNARLYFKSLIATYRDNLNPHYLE